MRCSSSRSTSPRTSSRASTVPNADPYLLPMAGLLTAIGVTEIYRLGPSDAFKQGLWIVIGVALFALALSGCAATTASSSSTSTSSASARSCCSSCRGCPGSARPSTAPGSGCTSARSVPAGRVLEDLPDRLPRRLPAREAGGARAGAAQGCRAAARDLGRVHARARLVERPRLGPPLLRDLPGDALHRDRAPLVRARRASGCSSPAASSPTRRSRTSTSA